MKHTAYVVKRRIDHDECPWLYQEVFEKGDVVYRYVGYTYGCISEDGVAVTRLPDQHPFLQLPMDALEEIKEKT